MNENHSQENLAPKAAEGSAPSSQKARNHSDAAREAAIAEKAAQMPKSCRAGYLRAAKGKASPRQAIKAFCLECTGWERNEVRRCTGVACPFWLYRPFRSERD